MNYSEVEVLDFVEGRLDDKQTAEFLAKQRNDPELAAAVRAMQASQLPIAEAYRQQPSPPVPDNLKRRLGMHPPADTPAEEISHNSRKNRVNLLMPIGLAACLALGMGFGALIMQQYVQNGEPATASITQPVERLPGELNHDRLVKRIADYQSLYVEKTVANLSESRINDAEKLLQSINTQANDNVSIPDLTSFGYQFARAQQLGFEGKSLIQLVYRKPGSAPLALCVMPDSAAQNLPMKVSEHHNLNAAGWVDVNQHYVLVTDESPIVLEQMYKTVLDTFQASSG